MYSHFVIPFVIGTIFLFGVIVYKYVIWFLALSKEQRAMIGSGFFTMKTLHGIGSVIKESLLHVSIFKHNTLLGYMHSSLAFGWFLLIVVGSIEVASVIGSGSPLYVHIFFKYFHPEAAVGTALFFAHFMDFLLLYVLTGVALAWYKRMKKRSMGMRKRTHHTLGDRVALSTLWLIFPIRLLAESVTSGINNSGGFMTGTIGRFLNNTIPSLYEFEMPVWWAYSIVLCLFFMAMPFSRYMHIFTEIPHIFLKYWNVKPQLTASKGDNFQVHSCSRCGICIDPCQLQSELNVNTIQAVYFLRGRRYGNMTTESIDNCLMCGRCETKCPVGIDINTLRLSARHSVHGGTLAESRYSYFGVINKQAAVESEDRILNKVNANTPKVGYFAGCMTLLSPAIIDSMTKIFNKSGDNVWFADKDGGVCCGRPLRLSGDIEASQKMVDFNRELFLRADIKTLVTSCPICLKTFKEDYDLESLGIEVLHHTQYIERKINNGSLIVEQSGETVTYHDPCELGRGLKIYDEPREVLAKVSHLTECSENREHALCCGHSLANNRLLQVDKNKISSNVVNRFKETNAKILVTACPQCKTAFNVNKEGMRVMDISELVVANLK